MSSSPLQVVPKPLSREGIIDRYGELDEAILRFAPTLAEHKQLTATISGWYESHPAGQPAIAKGKVYSINLTARKKERAITNAQKAFALLRKAVGGLEAAVACITIPLGAAVDKHIAPELHAQFISEGLTGNRTLKAVRNA